MGGQAVGTTEGQPLRGLLDHIRLSIFIKTRSACLSYFVGEEGRRSDLGFGKIPPVLGGRWIEVGQPLYRR